MAKETKMEQNAKTVKGIIEMGYPMMICWKWSESRARDTYGYNICTCYVHGFRVGKAIGGGYDMRGASLADFMNNAFVNELKALDAREDHYGLRQYHGKVNGACGLSCMISILEAMGYSCRFSRDANETEVYILKKEEAK